MSILVDDSNKTACRAAEAGLQQKNCAALVRPAGTGKGCIVWELLDAHPEMRVLWVVSCAARLELRRALTKRLGRTLGGRVRVEGRTLYAEPGGTLQGTVLEAPDLRGGAALVIAALAAQGSSRITHTEFIDRGYADFAQKLTALGGQIARETPRGADCPKKRTSKT